jgi:hypothetical protein
MAHRHRRVGVAGDADTCVAVIVPAALAGEHAGKAGVLLSQQIVQSGRLNVGVRLRKGRRVAAPLTSRWWLTAFDASVGANSHRRTGGFFMPRATGPPAWRYSAKRRAREGTARRSRFLLCRWSQGLATIASIPPA